MKKVFLATLIIALVVVIVVTILAVYFLKFKILFEGQEGTGVGMEFCIPGLTKIDALFPYENTCMTVNCPCFICAKCGDGKCGKGENTCNCPKDCVNNINNY